MMVNIFWRFCILSKKKTTQKLKLGKARTPIDANIELKSRKSNTGRGKNTYQQCIVSDVLCLNVIKLLQVILYQVSDATDSASIIVSRGLQGSERLKIYRWMFPQYLAVGDFFPVSMNFMFISVAFCLFSFVFFFFCFFVFVVFVFVVFFFVFFFFCFVFLFFSFFFFFLGGGGKADISKHRQL